MSTGAMRRVAMSPRLSPLSAKTARSPFDDGWSQPENGGHENDDLRVNLSS